MGFSDAAYVYAILSESVNELLNFGIRIESSHIPVATLMVLSLIFSNLNTLGRCRTSKGIGIKQ